jgi:5-aminolevulinate synthase
LKESSVERDAQQRAVSATKAALVGAGLPAMNTATHIVPIAVGEPDLCRKAGDLLLHEHAIYIQPINYPTVPRGTERLRITPTPLHDAALIGSLVIALVEVWQKIGLSLFAGGVAIASRSTTAAISNARVRPPGGG